MRSIIAVALCAVGLAAFAKPDAVQLWKDGPYFATCNVGATTPEEYGILTNFNDAAQAVTDALGDGWRVPTTNELEALLSNCSTNWVTCKNSDGEDIKGFRFTGKNTGYTDKSIFLPAAGSDTGNGREGSMGSGYYWSLNELNKDYAWCLKFLEVDAVVDWYSRRHGYSVRAVRDTPPEPPVPTVSGLSNAFALDIAAGDRVAQPTETLVVDPAWGTASVARVVLAGNWTRTYTCATNDLWDTTELEPGRYGLALFEDGWDPNDLYGATFWKTGDDWEVFDGSNITANTTFEAGKTYLILGTNTVSQGVELTVEDGVKFNYGTGSGLLGGKVVEPMPRQYEKKTIEGDFYQIVEKIKGCADNPWIVGNDGETPSPHEVEAYTNGNELVIGGKGTISDLSEIDETIKTGTKKLTITEATVTGAAKDAFAGVGGEDAVEVSLPDNWQGELPDENGALYGMTVDMSKFIYPKSVRNVKFQQRYPWNGLVDVTCDLSGAGTATLSATVLTNGVKLVKNPTLEGVLTLDLGEGCATNGVKFIWNAAEDLPAGFKAGGVTIKVTADIILPPPAGQLWENGPIWGLGNLGSPKAYGGLYTFHEATNEVTQIEGGWRLPMQEELEALVANCDREWTTQDAVPGWLFKGQGAFEGNSVFLPNAGYDPGDGRKFEGATGTYWSSTPDGESDDAFYLYLTQGGEPDVTLGDMDSNRLSVRPVKDAR